MAADSVTMMLAGVMVSTAVAHDQVIVLLLYSAIATYIITYGTLSAYEQYTGRYLLWDMRVPWMTPF